VRVHDYGIFITLHFYIFDERFTRIQATLVWYPYLGADTGVQEKLHVFMLLMLYMFTFYDCIAKTLFISTLDCLTYISIYSILCLLHDFILKLKNEKTKDHKNDEEINPHSSEGDMPFQTGEVQSTEQNVQFLNTHPGYKSEIASNVDSLRDAPLKQDATLDDFFSRPIRILTTNWVVSNPVFVTFDPWSLFLENKRVLNRLSNYRLLRCKLNVRVVINGNGFYSGRAIMSYLPLHTYDNFTVTRQFFSQDLIGMSQRPHIFIDPTTSQAGDMVLPFFTFRNLLDIPGQQWREMGSLTIKSLNNLRHANDGTDPVTINVFAWATDVKFSIPTHFEPGALSPQSDEYTGPVSRIATAVAKYAGYLTRAPVIAPYALATKIGAESVGVLANLFGFSRPIELSTVIATPKTKGALAVSNMRDDANKLTLDVKQELTIDPRVAGLSDTDELSINYIATRESYLTSFDWARTSPAEDLLWNCVVDPGLYDIEGDFKHLTSCAFACMPFRYWRGTIKFRFQIVSSAFHRGRLKIVYDPVATAPNALVAPGDVSAEYNTAYTTIIDIADNTDFVIECGWGQDTTYREHHTLVDNQNMYSDILLSYNSLNFPYGNGTIAVYVVNILTTPNSLGHPSIPINVFVSACDDFEVAVPSGEDLSMIRFSQLTPQSDEITELQDNSAPAKTDSLDTMGNMLSTSDSANLVHFGERISFFRQLIKRYTLSEVLPGNDGFASGVGYIGRIVRYHKPLIGGALPSSLNLDTTTVVRDVRASGIGEYVFAFTHLINYVTLAFGGWRGSVRYFVDASSAFTGPATLTAERTLDGGFPYNAYIASPVLNTVAGQIDYFNTHGGSAEGFNGLCLQNTEVNPSLSFESPYYSAWRFSPAKRRDVFESGAPTPPDIFQPQYILSLQARSNGWDTSPIRLYAAAGEDYTCFFYLGPPRIFLEEDVPA
jgi:hypothetical protein